MIKVKRALVSVSDKTGLLEFVKGLQTHGIEIISTGGTAKHLKSAAIPVTEVSQYTGFPEILEGRVKTLHPKIHGGLLALRDSKEHSEQLKEHDIGAIDMVVVNLYPFEKVTQKKNVAFSEAVENIDIGGPSMLRSGARNFKSVAVVSNPKRYKEILRELEVNSGMLSDKVLMDLAIETFHLTSQYDAVIFAFLNNRMKSGGFTNLPKDLTLSFSKVQDLRYGENPHQAAAFYSQRGTLKGLAKMKQLNGKELSFNNLLDLNAALDIIKDFREPAAVIIKHNNPTGVAQDTTLAKAFKAALACDPVSAFGGIIGFNMTVDRQTARLVEKSGFMECVLAPGFDKDALAVLKKKKNFRILQLKFNDCEKESFDFKKINGGLLFQEKDTETTSMGDLSVVSKAKPTKAQMESLLFGWKVVKHVKSNAMILVKGTKTVGIGCGQTSRVESVNIAVRKAGRNARNALLISDAFIPKTDNIKLAAQAGISAIIQTGGSIADKDVIQSANRHKLVMVTTSVRHFKH